MTRGNTLHWRHIYLQKMKVSFSSTMLRYFVTAPSVFCEISIQILCLFCTFSLKKNTCTLVKNCSHQGKVFPSTYSLTYDTTNNFQAYAWKCLGTILITYAYPRVATFKAQPSFTKQQWKLQIKEKWSFPFLTNVK